MVFFISFFNNLCYIIQLTSNRFIAFWARLRFRCACISLCFASPELLLLFTNRPAGPPPGAPQLLLVVPPGGFWLLIVVMGPMATGDRLICTLREPPSICKSQWHVITWYSRWWNAHTNTLNHQNNFLKERLKMKNTLYIQIKFDAQFSEFFW